MTSQPTALLLGLLGTTKQTSSPCSNKTSLLSLHGVPGDGRSLTNMLVVTTTVRVIDGVHGNTTGLGPAVALHSELVLGARSLCVVVSTQLKRDARESRTRTYS
jgi:hypothetical protein